MRIYKRYKHRPEWHLDFRYKDKDGKIKRRIEVVGTSKRLAQEALHKYRALAADAKRAVVGAGTTVTIDVPDDALAVSRVRQKNIKGYTKRRRS